MTPLNVKLAAADPPPAIATEKRADIVAFLGDGESEAIVRQALADRLDNPGAIRRGTIDKAIESLTAERSPNLLIVDVSGIDLPVSKINHLAEVCEPGVHVIAVGDRSEIGLYRDLLHAGVTDYIAKPLTRELILKSVQLATHGPDMGRISHKLGKLVAILGTRGGIGTTSVAVNLAWYLANRHGRRVALVDLDLQTGDCGLMLGLESNSGLREALENPYRIDNLFLERVMAPSGNRLFVLSAQESPYEELRFSPDAAETLIAALRSQFHYVIVDVPRIRTAINQRFIDLATVRIIVADETIRSAREIVRLRALLGETAPNRTNLLVVNRRGERSPGFIPHKEFVGAVDMQPVASIPIQALGRGSAASYGPPAASGHGKMADAIAELASEVSGRRLEEKPWKRWWR